MDRGGAAPGESRRIEPGRAVAAGSAVLAAVAAGWVAWSGGASAAPPPSNGKVTLCHARPPATAANGWVQITVSTNAVTHEGHDGHSADIIPAFDYYDHRTTAHYPGKNLSTAFSGETGADILAHGCHLAAGPTPIRTSTSPARPRPSRSAVSSTEAPSSAAARIPSRDPITPTPTVPTAAQPGPPAAVSTIPAKARPARSTIAARTSSAAGDRAAPAAVVHAGLAAGDTGDRAERSSGSAGWYAAVVGGGAAGLLGLAGLAYRRRRGLGAGS
jgi:hypothetical protein